MKSEHKFTPERNFDEQYNKLVKTRKCKEINKRITIKRTSRYETKTGINGARTKWICKITK